MGPTPGARIDPHADLLTWDQILARPRLATRLFLPLCLLCIALFLVWADGAELDQVARGSGRVIPSSQLQVVQNLEGGILSEILVREGQRVARGQVLVRIDDTGFASSYREQRARYLGHLAAIARLEAEATGKAPRFPPEVLAEPSLAERELELFRSRQSSIQSAVSALRQQAEQRQREVAELENRAQALERSVALAREELKLIEPLFAQGAASKVEVLRLQREVNDMAGNLQSTRLMVGKAQAGFREAEQRVAEKLAAYRAESLAQLSENRIKLRSLEETQAAAEDRVNRTEVRAPLDGIVKRIRITTLGGVIKPGQDILEIVPSDDTLLIEAKVSPADIAHIHPGQEVVVKLTAFDYAIYGGLPGVIEQVGADSIVDDKGNITYQVLIRTLETRLSRRGQTIDIIPGMVAEVDILTGKRTILQYLLRPVNRMRDYGLRER
ncbi:MAG: HlyD family type I secretion periplasmic adaptor subunit [Alphaproteobacteria bacterium]|nr:HlyD family type I secretion periplasmic adaptor subunit [Alphaproteobacteria bacterium]